MDCQANHNNKFLHWSAAINLEALLFLGHLPFLPPLKQQHRNQPRYMFRVARSFSLNGQKYFSRPFSFPSESFQCILDRTNTTASALLFYRRHLDKAGGRHISTGVLLSSSLCSAKASLCGWEWPLDEKPIRLGQKQLQLGAEGAETILWLVLGGTAREASEKPVCPSKAVPRRVLTHHALSYRSSQE